MSALSVSNPDRVQEIVVKPIASLLVASFAASVVRLVLYAAVLVGATSLLTLMSAGRAHGAPAPEASFGLAITPGGLTADAVALRAASTSFEVQGRAAEARAAEASVSQADAAYLPRLSGGARYARLSPIEQPALGTLVAAPGVPPGPLAPGAALVAVPLTFPVILDQYVAQASLTVPLSDYLLRLPRGHASAEARRRAAQLTLRAARLASAQNARQLFFGWAKARWQVAVAEQTLAQARAQRETADKRAEVGSASKADVLRVQSLVASAELLATHTRTQAEVLEQQLRTVLHDEREGAYEVGEDVQSEVALPAAAATVPLTRLYEEALERRLETRALDAVSESLVQQAKVLRAVGLPRLDAVASALYANPNPRFIPAQDTWRGTWEAGLQLTWAPTDTVATESQRREVLAQVEATQAQKRALEDGIRREVSQAQGALREALQAQHAASRGLAASEEGYRVRKLLLDTGRATTVEMLDAETDLLRARWELIGARLDARAAKARLEHALGRDVHAGT